MEKEFLAECTKFTANPLWSYHIRVPEDIARYFLDRKINRVMCTLNEKITFHAPVLSDGNAYYFINLNAERRKILKIDVGVEMHVGLSEDVSEYGMNFPMELEEALRQDEKAKNYFLAMTPGVQRTLIHMVDKLKSSDKRIEKSVIISRHLVKMKGKVDYKILMQDFKEGI